MTKRGFLRLAERFPWLGVFGIFLVSRLLVVAGVLAAGNRACVNAALAMYRLLFNVLSPSGSSFAVHPFTFNPQARSFFDFAKSWDSFWYLDIAAHGYAYDGTTQHQSITFYPFLPWLVKVFAKWLMMPLTGLPLEQAILITGIVVSNVLFLASLALLFTLIRQKSGSKTAWWSVGLLALYPGSLFCSLFLTEGCFLACSVAFFLALERRALWFAAFLSWPACLTRFNGISLLFSYIAKTGWRKLLQKPHYWILPVLLAGVLLYPLYLAWGLGDPGLYLKMHSHYRGQLPVLKLTGLIFVLGVVWLLYSDEASIGVKRHPLIRRIAYYGQWLMLVGIIAFFICSILNLAGFSGPWTFTQHLLPVHLGPVMAATALGLVLFGLYQYKLEPAYKVYAVLNLFPLLFSGTFFSNHRYLTLIFPLFWGLALGLQNHPRWQAFVSALFALLLLGLSVLYAAMGWLMIF
jgi:hypothetical protein